MKPQVSVIVIDYKKNNPFLEECLAALHKQTYINFEVILESDHPLLSSPLSRGRVGRGFSNLRVVNYAGKYQTPAKKRDHAGQIAKGEFLAFIDDDASPHKDWLKNLVVNFSDPTIVAVGGPGVTPNNVSWAETASGWMSASPMGAGPYTYRFLPGKRQFVDDYPSMNLAVRKDAFLAVGGFDSHYWPGEDTKLCLDLVNKTKGKIIYDPKVIVYHHRRPLWRPHLRQNGSFGLHRGFFARTLPQTSLRPVYLGPPFMILGLLYLILFSHLFLNPHALKLNNLGWLLFSGYLLAIAHNSFWVYRHSQSLFQGLISFPAVLITHLWYGLLFLQGFCFTKKLPR